MAVAALLLWLCTAAVGTYLLVTAIQSASADRSASPPGLENSDGQAGADASAGTEAADPVTVGQPAAQARSAGATRFPPPAPVRPKDRWDPPSLQRAKADSFPGLRDLAEFAHPALAMIGFAFWLGYVVSRDRLFAAIGLGILLGAVCAGLSWYAVNTRARKRAAGDAAGDHGSGKPGPAPLAPARRLLILHGAGAILTVLFVALSAARF
ncbi:MAG TPA: hypothetical protein VGM12_02615 [Trebonia sp.]